MNRPRQRHEIVIHNLMVKIFNGQLKPGEKLPTEKQLSQDMSVDRTTLRVALKQLESMQLLDIRQGDGIYVKDYIKHAGLDFLRLLYLFEDEEEAVKVTDPYLIDEIWEFWISLLPAIIRMAARKFSTRDFKAIMDLLEKSRESLHDLEKVIDYELAQQDLVSRISGNTIVILIFNSSRPLRRHMFKIFVNSVGPEDVRENIETKINLIRDYASGSYEKAVEGIEKYRKLLSKFRDKVRKTLLLEHE